MLKFWAISALVCIAGPAFADVSAAEITYQSCRVCHDTAAGAAIPPLAGRSQAELEAAFAAMEASPEAQSIMHRFTAGLSADEIAALTAFIASQTGAKK